MNIIYFIVTIYIFVSFLRLFRSILAFNKIKKEQLEIEKINIKEIQKNDLPFFFILLPALSEQSIVEETILHFNNLKYEKDKIIFFTITTERENFERTNKLPNLNKFIENIYKNEAIIGSENKGLFPQYLFNEIIEKRSQVSFNDFKDYIISLYKNYKSTKEQIEFIIKKNEHKLNFDFFNIHYPNEKGNKSSQLNYTLDFIKDNFQSILNNNTCYIGVYDFDSKPDYRTIEGIVKKIKKNQNIYVWQQIPLPILGLYDNTNFFENQILRAYNILHVRRCLGIELIMHSNNKNNILTPLKYCMGAGLYFEYNTLLKINKFPEPIDDIPLGYRISLQNIKSDFVPYFNLVYGTNKIRFIFGQTKNIFWGLIINLFEEVKNKDIKINYYIAYYRTISTIFSNFIIPFSIIPSIMLLFIDNTFFIALIILYITYGLSGFIILIIIDKILKKLYDGIDIKLEEISKNIYEKLYLFIFSPFRGIIRSIVIINAIINIIKIKINKKKTYQVSKTER